MAGLTEPWPVGLRFKPTEDELVSHHLAKKLKGEIETICVIPDLYIYNCDPLELFTRYNELSSIRSDGRECFFFCPQGRKRKTKCGFWKETSSKRVVQAPDTGKEIGFKRNLVYHKGRQRNAYRTNLKMLEYHLKSDVLDSEIPDPTALVLCHIINRKSEKAKSESASSSTDFSSPRNLDDSQNEGTQETSAQASPEVAIEFPYLDEASSFNLTDQKLPTPDQQLQTSKEQCLSYDDHQHVDGPNDGRGHPPYSPSNDIDLVGFFNFEESTDEHAKLE